MLVEQDSHILGQTRLTTRSLRALQSLILYSQLMVHSLKQNEAFYDANRAILEWQMANGGCPENTCAFIQFHAKAPWSCVSDQVFMSSGLGELLYFPRWMTSTKDDVPYNRVIQYCRTRVVQKRCPEAHQEAEGPFTPILPNLEYFLTIR